MSSSDTHVADLVEDYVHQLLGPEDMARVERHCATCAACQAAMEAAHKRWAVLRAVPPCEASGQLVQDTLNRIYLHERKRRRRRRWVLGSFAAALALWALLLGGVDFYYQNLHASPFDLAVLGQNQLEADSPGSVRVRLTDRATNSPVAGAPVTVELRDRTSGQATELARFTTDAHGGGQPHFRLPDRPGGNFELRVTAQTSGGSEVVARQVWLKRSWKVMLSSDKPVYQPGQEIHVRSLALRRSDLKPVAGQPATFTIADPKGNVIFKKQADTSKHGLGGFDCPLAREIQEGPYTIACKLGDTESKLTVEVKTYVLPKFKIDAQLDKTFYQPGETVRGTVRADYFFGKHVADGEVEIEVKTQGQQPPVAEKLTAHTGADGTATFVYRIPDKLVGLPQYSGDARLFFQVQVTDRAGQKQTRTVERVVTTQPVRIEAVAEGGTLVEGVANTIYLLTTYADGRPARTRLTVSGIERVLETNELGLASFPFTPTLGTWSWTIRAEDGQGTVLARRHLQLSTGAAGSDFLLRIDKAVYRGGDTMNLSILGGGTEPVFVDFLKDGQTVRSETIDVANGLGNLAFDLPADLFGTVQICAYRFGFDSVAVRKTRVVYINPPGQLKITTTLGKPEYRPGEKARLNLTLTDEKGAPCPGALSLAGVDEALFSVLEQAPGTERTFFTLEQELLKPVYAIYPWAPAWMPGPATPPVRDFEQVVFARTAQSEGRSDLTASSPGSPFSLSANTFPGKVEEMQQTRVRWQERVRTGFFLEFLAIPFLGYITLWLFVRASMMLRFHLIGGLFALSAACLFFLARDELSVRDKDPSSRPGTNLGAKVARNMPTDAVAQFETKSLGLAEPPNAVLPPGAKEAAGESEPVRVRESFPETLLWRPEVITDESGHASLDIELADSITTWRLSASAVTTDGRLGAAQAPLKVFQSFFVDLNLPVTLTRGDEVAVPVVVYNYLDRPQTVTLTLDHGAWFERLDGAEQRLDLGAGEVRSCHYRLRVRQVGFHELTVTARGGKVADAVKRKIEVVPDGRRVEQVVNGTLGQPAEVTLTVPPDAIEGSARAFVKIYPSSFSQLVEGLDNIFQMPSGCFEQTSSTTYPNVLALDYLRRTKQSAPGVEAKARQYIHLGYQRLLGFEVAGGGFEWFGHPPANRTLTAYGLMEFEDMARVHDVDPNVIQRTRQWLLAQRQPDGSWAEEGHVLHEDPTRGQDPGQHRLATTAYLAWAVFGAGDPDNRGRVTLDYLAAHRPETIRDAHVLALVCNALLALDPRGSTAKPYLERLDVLKKVSEDGKLAHWEQDPQARTTFYGAGVSGQVETTALAALALIRGNQFPASTRAALSWLVSMKDANGTWHSTQATVLSLKALLAGTGASLGGDRERRIEVHLGQTFRKVVVIPADQGEVMQLLDLSGHLVAGPQRLTITETSDTAAGYQVSFRYHTSAAEGPAPNEPLAIDVAYDGKELAVGDTLRATARVANRMGQPAAMVMLDLPVPAGFAPVSEDFSDLVGKNVIARFQVQARSVLVYLRDLKAGQRLELTYRLRATMPVKVTVPGARVYEYYDPDRQGRSAGAKLTVREK